MDVNLVYKKVCPGASLMRMIDGKRFANNQVFRKMIKQRMSYIRVAKFFLLFYFFVRDV